jgi:hypothetical protein
LGEKDLWKNFWLKECHASALLCFWQENPCEHPIVILKDVRYCDLESLLKYMYAGQVHIKQDQLGRSAYRDIIYTARLKP